MRKITNLKMFLSTKSISFILFSCQKAIDGPAVANEIATVANAAKSNRVTPYKFERINVHNFYSQGWKEQQVNIISGTTIFSDQSDYVEIVCGPENNSDSRLLPGCITMKSSYGCRFNIKKNTSSRRGGYSGTLLADVTELKYSTYVVNNAPTIMVLQIDVTGDDAKDFNIYFEPTQVSQGSDYPPVVLNTWQQWNALQGTWHPEAVTISGLPTTFTISQLVALHANARIIDTHPLGHNGEGVRFTIGGSPRSAYDNTVGYFDALIIGTKNEQVSTVNDFTCSQGNH